MHQCITENCTDDSGIPKTFYFSIFNVSGSGYYSWLKRREKREQEMTERANEDMIIKMMMREIILKLSYIPGKRTFRAELLDKYNMTVSVKRCARLMKEMNIVAYRPKKDAYKHQAVHDHQCASPANLVNQNFYIGPRRVIVTDITYIYYGSARTTAYLCIFKDAYTKEILGYEVSGHMDVGLVKSAYDSMMKLHGKEFPSDVKCFCHSDSGSQYLSTTFKDLLKNDCFIQSVSARGNSQDNAVCESFFARFKCHTIDTIARCRSLETAREIIDGYMYSYNNVAVQYNIGGLTPSDFYTYKTTGIYPMDEYFGVDNSRLIPIIRHRETQLRFAEKQAEKRREAWHKREYPKETVEPRQMVYRDGRIISARINATESLLLHYRNLKKEIENAYSYLDTLSTEAYDSLRNPHEWKYHKPLEYIYDMKGMF